MWRERGRGRKGRGGEGREGEKKGWKVVKKQRNDERKRNRVSSGQGEEFVSVIHVLRGSLFDNKMFQTPIGPYSVVSTKQIIPCSF